MDLKKFRERIERVRGNSNLWKELEFDMEESDLKRYALSKALQYSYTKKDYDLIYFLLCEEIKGRRNDEFQGFGDCLILLSYLLASFKRPENAVVFETAKLANFDTFCGYDARFIFSAGVKETYDYLQSIELDDKNGYLYRDGQLLITEITDDDIEKLFNKLKVDYPGNPDEETIVAGLSTAITLNDKDKFKDLFEALESSDESNNQQLSYYAKMIGQYDKEIYYLNLQYKNAIKSYDKASLLLKMSEAYVSWDKLVDSYHVFVDIKPLLKKVDNWKKIGLGQTVTHQWFKLSLALNKMGESELAKKAYVYADELIWIISKPSCVLLRDANQVVALFGSNQEKKRYQSELDKEEHRIKEILGK